MAVEGFNYKIEINTPSVDISGQSNSVSLSPSKNVDDATPFGVEWKEKTSGIKDWKGQIKLFYTEGAAEAFALLWAAFEGNAAIPIKLSPTGGSVGEFQFSGNVHIAGLSHEASPDGGNIAAPADFEGTGTLDYAAVSA
jgi:hypothetical protein